MARTEKVIMTNMCMVFSENRVLVQDKRDDDYSGITFPGGHVERGESFTDASPFLDENQMRQALPIKWSSGTRPNKRESHRFTGLLDAIQ